MSVDIVIVGQFVTVFAVAESAKNVCCYPILSCKRLTENISNYFPRAADEKFIKLFVIWQKRLTKNIRNGILAKEGGGPANRLF